MGKTKMRITSMYYSKNDGFNLGYYCTIYHRILLFSPGKYCCFDIWFIPWKLFCLSTCMVCLLSPLILFRVTLWPVHWTVIFRRLAFYSLHVNVVCFNYHERSSPGGILVHSLEDLFLLTRMTFKEKSSSNWYEDN